MPLATRNAFNDEAFVNFDSALQFDGVDDQIVIPANNDYFSNGNNGLWCSFFAKMQFDVFPPVSTQYMNIFYAGNEAASTYIEVYILAGSISRVSFDTRSNGGTNLGRILTDPKTYLNNNVWFHVMLNYSDGYGYVNGVRSGAGATTSVQPDLKNINLKIGFGHHWSNSYFKGQIRDLAFFNIPDPTIITDAVVEKFKMGSLVPEELHPYCFAHFPLDNIKLR